METFTWKCVKALFLKYFFLVYTSLHCQSNDPDPQPCFFVYLSSGESFLFIHIYCKRHFVNIYLYFHVNPTRSESSRLRTTLLRISTTTYSLTHFFLPLFQSMNLINYYKGQYIICLQKDLLDKHQKVHSFALFHLVQWIRYGKSQYLCCVPVPLGGSLLPSFFRIQ